MSFNDLHSSIQSLVPHKPLEFHPASPAAAIGANQAAMDGRERAAHVELNRAYWNGRASDWVAAGERHWSQDSPCWGLWSVPEVELEMLPLDMRGMRAVELGCGTGYVSSWMARRGAEVTGIDASEAQLRTARRFAERHGLALTLVHGDAESTPFGDASFDFAISEYGAATWCDPYRWVPEAHRLLVPGGRLVFLGNHPLLAICMSADGHGVAPEFARPYRGLYRQDWSNAKIDPGGIDFHLPIADWFALFRRIGFAIEDYRELYAGPDAEDASFGVGAAWARQWPTEQVWKLRKL